MLEDVRRSARSGLSYIMVAGLIVIFAFFFGVPADGCSSAPGARKHVATVAGEKVHTDDLNVIYNQVFGTRERGEEAQIQRQQALALKAYLIIELLAHKAREAGLRVSDEEFQQYMQDPVLNQEFLSAYGSTGSWDGQFYQRYVQNLLRVSLPEYEDFKRDELLARKYMHLVDMQVGVLPSEIASLETLRNTKVNLEFIKFQPDQLAEYAEVSDEAVQEYIAANSDKIKEYYEDNKADYGQPAKLAVSRIYLDRASQGPQGNSAEERFEAAKKRLDAGEDFATVATEINDAAFDPDEEPELRSAENMTQEVVDALEGAEVGEVREIKTPDSLMLVKLEKKKEAVAPSLEELQDEIARTLLQQQKVDELVAQTTQTLMDKAKETGSLSAALEALRPQAPAEDAEEAEEADAEEADAEEAAPDSVWSALEVQETGDFTLESQDMSAMFRGQLPPGMKIPTMPWDRIPKIGQSRGLAVDAFTELTEEKPLAEKVYTVNDSKVIASLKSKTKVSDPELAEGEDTAEGEDAAEAGDEQSAEEEKQQLVRELRQGKVVDMVGDWQSLFNRRTPYGASLRLEYGPWIERQFKDAVEAGVIDLESGADPMVAYVDPTAVAPEPPTGGAPGAGSPIQVQPGSGAGAAPPQQGGSGEEGE